MIQKFANRREAGRKIAGRLSHFFHHPELLVLALPRGGVPVAREIAAVLGAPLDVLVVRKLGLPDDEETAMGAIGPGGACVLNRALVRATGVSESAIARVLAREKRELRRRESLYHAGASAPEFRGRIVLLVDDGVATGATMRAAIAVVREGRPSRVVVVAPVFSREAYLELHDKADELVALQIAKDFGAVGEFYADFSPVEDEEVCATLAGAACAVPRG
jgi:putative phosphoribosyl transferase